MKLTINSLDNPNDDVFGRSKKKVRPNDLTSSFFTEYFSELIIDVNHFNFKS